MRLEPVILRWAEFRDVQTVLGWALASRSEWGLRLEPVILRWAESRGVQTVWRWALPLPSERGSRLEPVILRWAEFRDVQKAWGSALASRTGWGLGPEPGDLPARLASEMERALPWALALPSALAAQRGPLKAVWLREAEVSAWSDAPELPRPAAAVVSARAAAEAVAEMSVRAAAAAEAGVVSAHAAAGPQPAAGAARWVRGAVGGPDGSGAAQEAGVAASGVPARRPAAAVQPRAAVRRAAWAQQADPLALPSEAASVFRQGPSLAGPARPRAAARFAHELRGLQIASRSGPSWQAARNEGWSCG